MIVLASASPRRKELLSLIVKDFKVVPSKADENIIEVNPYKMVEELSKRKALEVFSKYPNDVVIGSDTIVALGDKILGKPKDSKEAKAMLNKLSGKKHCVYTGVYLISKNKKDSFVGQAEVTFKLLSNEEIEEYINTEEPFDKAGAYGIQGFGSKYVKEIKGDYFSIVGLPVNMLYEKMKENNYI